MNKSPLTTILLAILTVSALASAVLCWRHISATRELRALQTQAGAINNNRAAVQNLLNETVAYSKKNPAIEPILEAAGLKLKADAAPQTNGRPAAMK